MTSAELINIANENNFIQRLAEVERRLKLVEGQAIGADQIPDVTEHMMINGPIGLANLITSPPAPAPGENTGEFSINQIYVKDNLLYFLNGTGVQSLLTGLSNPGLVQSIAVTPFALNDFAPIGMPTVTGYGTQADAYRTFTMDKMIKSTSAASASSGAGFRTTTLGYTGKLRRMAGNVGLFRPNNPASSGQSFYFGLFSAIPYSNPDNMFAVGLRYDTGGGYSDISLFVQTGNLLKTAILFNVAVDIDTWLTDYGSMRFEIYLDSYNRRLSAQCWPTKPGGLSTSYASTWAVIDDVTLDFTTATRFYSIVYAGDAYAQSYWFGGAYVEFNNDVKIAPDSVTLSWDTDIQSDAATTNYKTNAKIYAGESNAAVNRIYRTLINFDMTGFAYTNPVPRIGEAVLSLYLNTDLSSTARTFRVYRILKAMTADATWNTYDGSNNWTTAGGFDAADCEQTDIGSVTLTATESAGWITIPLDAQKVEEMINGTFTNHGLLIMADTETNDAYGFSSSEGANVPYLTVYEL